MNFDRTQEIEPVEHGSSDDPAVLDFSANINPETPPGVEAVYRDAFERAGTYPPEPPTGFCEQAANYVDCPAETVVPTPGGLAGLRLVVSLLVSEGDQVLVPAPSFGEYAREVTVHGGEPVFVTQDELLAQDPAPYGLVIVCNPNNPTGTRYESDRLQSFAARCRESATPLVVDEAFLGFTEQPSLAGTDGVIVLRSLTKLFGMPGIRTGFVVATGQYSDALQGARLPWNVSVPALQTGTYCMRQEAFVRDTRERVREERARMRECLADQYDIGHSDAPFLLLDVGDRSVDAILDHCLDHGIAIRDARSFRGLDRHVRIAVRRPGENDRLVEVLRNV